MFLIGPVAADHSVKSGITSLLCLANQVSVTKKQPFLIPSAIATIREICEVTRLSAENLTKDRLLIGFIFLSAPNRGCGVVVNSWLGD
jgi:hypothetical protein